MDADHDLLECERIAVLELERRFRRFDPRFFIFELEQITGLRRIEALMLMERLRARGLVEFADDRRGFRLGTLMGQTNNRIVDDAERIRRGEPVPPFEPAPILMRPPHWSDTLRTKPAIAALAFVSAAALDIVGALDAVVAFLSKWIW